MLGAAAIGAAIYCGQVKAITRHAPVLQVCHYQGGTYSVGALLRMGRTERICRLSNGMPTWSM